MDRNTKIPNLSTRSPTVCKLNFVEIPKRNVSCVTETSEKKKQDKADLYFIYFIKAAKVESRNNFCHSRLHYKKSKCHHHSLIIIIFFPEIKI